MANAIMKQPFAKGSWHQSKNQWQNKQLADLPLLSP
jgi:hypothetical protein